MTGAGRPGATHEYVEYTDDSVDFVDPALCAVCGLHFLMPAAIEEVWNVLLAEPVEDLIGRSFTPGAWRAPTEERSQTGDGSRPGRLDPRFPQPVPVNDPIA